MAMSISQNSFNGEERELPGIAEPHAPTSGSDPLSMVEALSDMMASYIAYYDLIGDDREREYARRAIWYLVNKLLELMPQTRYVPGLVEELSTRITYKLWDMPEKELDELRELVITTYIFSRSSEDALGVSEIRRYSDTLRNMLYRLGYIGDSELVENILDSMDYEKMVSLATLALVLASNI
jgi:hypothetical protein